MTDIERLIIEITKLPIQKVRVDAYKSLGLLTNKNLSEITGITKGSLVSCRRANLMTSINEDKIIKYLLKDSDIVVDNLCFKGGGELTQVISAIQKLEDMLHRMKMYRAVGGLNCPDFAKILGISNQSARQYFSANLFNEDHEKKIINYLTNEYYFSIVNSCQAITRKHKKGLKYYEY